MVMINCITPTPVIIHQKIRKHFFANGTTAILFFKRLIKFVNC